MTITLDKHQALGNDFLVCDTAQALPAVAWDVLARTWCDRRRGVGADGLLMLTIEGDDVLTMVLHNADGSRAEMSGNGIRCLAQAAHRAQGRSGRWTYKVQTDAGVRTVDVMPVSARAVDASVDMGAITATAEVEGWSSVGANPDRPVAHLDIGNPHVVVCVEDTTTVDLAAIGRQVPQVNVEIVSPGPEPHAVTMRVHERGAGITEACGTGACASAWAARSWGIVPASATEILVHMDGGDAKVRVNDPAPGHLTLVGPSVHIATVTL